MGIVRFWSLASTSCLDSAAMDEVEMDALA